MDWDALGAIGEIVGAIAVVATLIYLSRQVRSAERTTRIELRDRHILDWRDFYRNRGSNPLQRSVLYEVGATLDENIDDAKLNVWIDYILQFFIQLQADYDLHLEGVYSDEDLHFFVRQRLHLHINQLPRTRLSWEKMRAGGHPHFTSAFVKFVDQELKLPIET